MKIGPLTVTTFLILLLTFTASTQDDAYEIVTKSIAYHDPDGLLEKQPISLYFTETRPNGTRRKSEYHHNPKLATTYISREINNVSLGMVDQNGDIRFVIDEKYKPTDKQIEEYKLSNEAVNRMTNYYQYLWYLPSKLLDYGSIIHDQVKKATFDGQQLLEIKVSYEEEVGKDTWYFYFDPVTFALSGYRFYHDEDANDGEYILLKGEAKQGTLRMPQERMWYTHKDDQYLGTDILDRIVVQQKKKMTILPDRMFQLQ